jgi:DNA-binding Lrp family transcriptional regulator
VDSKDFQLLAALYENARQSYRRLGSRVSLSAPAVRDRLKALERKGIIHGYWVTPDPTIFDRQDLLVFYETERTREDAIKALKVSDVAFAAMKVDGGLTVQLWPLNREESIKQLTITLGQPSGQALAEHRPRPPLSLTDWRIIDALLDDPRMELEQVCKSTGLSHKTVRKHLSNMIQNETVYITPRLGTLSGSGELVYHLTVEGKVSLSELRRSLGDAVLVNETKEPPLKYLLCRARDLADVTSKTAQTAKLRGVNSVRVTLNREILVATEFVHSLVRARIRAIEDSHPS